MIYKYVYICFNKCIYNQYSPCKWNSMYKMLKTSYNSQKYRMFWLERYVLLKMICATNLNAQPMNFTIFHFGKQLPTWIGLFGSHVGSSEYHIGKNSNKYFFKSNLFY